MTSSRMVFRTTSRVRCQSNVNPMSFRCQSTGRESQSTPGFNWLLTSADVHSEQACGRKNSDSSRGAATIPGEGTHGLVRAYRRTETAKGSVTEAPCWNRRSTHGLRGRIHQADAQTAETVCKESGQRAVLAEVIFLKTPSQRLDHPPHRSRKSSPRQSRAGRSRQPPQLCSGESQRQRG
jgi:hypothetical protein